METFKRILSYARPFRNYWPAYLLLSILSVIFGMINYALVNPLLTVLFDPNSVETYATLPEFSFTIDYVNGVFQYYLTKIIGTSGYLRGLLYICFLLMIASLVSNLTRYFSQRILVNMKTNLMKGLRRDLFNKVTKMHVGYYQDKRKGDILSSISNDVNEVQNSIASSFHIVFREPLLIIGFLSGLFYFFTPVNTCNFVNSPYLSHSYWWRHSQTSPRRCSNSVFDGVDN